MASKTIKCDDFEKAVSQIMESYFDDVATEGNELIAKTAVRSVKELQSTSPKDKGDYANDWAIKSIRNTKSGSELVIHNRKHYQLTHLLEKGHVKVVHGKVLGFTSPKVHIAPVERDAIETIEKGYKVIIEGGR